MAKDPATATTRRATSRAPPGPRSRASSRPAPMGTRRDRRGRQAGPAARPTPPAPRTPPPRASHRFPQAGASAPSPLSSAGRRPPARGPPAPPAGRGAAASRCSSRSRCLLAAALGVAALGAAAFRRRRRAGARGRRRRRHARRAATGRPAAGRQHDPGRRRPRRDHRRRPRRLRLARPGRHAAADRRRPRRARRRRRSRSARNPDQIAAGKGTVWVVDAGERRAPAAAERPRAPADRDDPVGKDAQGISLGPQLAWVANTGDDTVQRVDRATATAVGDPIGVGDHPIGIFVGSKVWVTNFRDGTLSQIDIATAQVEGDPLPTGERRPRRGRGLRRRLGLQPQGRHRRPRRPRHVRGGRDDPGRRRAEGARRQRSARSGSSTAARTPSRGSTPRPTASTARPIPVGRNPHRDHRDRQGALGDQLRATTPSARSGPSAWTRPASSPTRRSPPARPRPGPRRTPASSRTRPRRSGTRCSAATETLRYRPGEVVLRAGERDRAFYLLLDGRVEAEGAGTRRRARRGRRRRVPRRRCRARSRSAPAAHGELARMSWDAYEVLAARDPRLGRAILAELGRGLAARAARRRPAAAGVDGMTAFPNYTQIPARLPIGAWQAIRVVTLLGAIGLAMALVVAPDDGALRAVEGRHPRAAAALARRAGPVAQRLPALGVQPDAAGARAVEGADRAAVAQGVRLRDRARACSSLFVSLRKVGLDDSGPASALLLLGALAGGFAGGTLLKGKSGWCSSICPLLPDPAAVRPDAVQARRELALHAVRRLHQVLLRLQPAGRLPRRPARPGPVLERLPQAVRGGLPGPRARVLHAARGARRRRRSRRSTGSSRSTWRQRRGLLRARLAAEGLDPQADDAVRRRPASRSSTGTPPSRGASPRCGPRAASRSRSPPAGSLRTYAKERAFAAQAGAPAPEPSAAPVIDLAAGRSMASHRALSAGRAGGQRSSPRASASSPSRG